MVLFPAIPRLSSRGFVISKRFPFSTELIGLRPCLGQGSFPNGRDIFADGGDMRGLEGIPCLQRTV